MDQHHITYITILQYYHHFYNFVFEYSISGESGVIQFKFTKNAICTHFCQFSLSIISAASIIIYCSTQYIDNHILLYFAWVNQRVQQHIV